MKAHEKGAAGRNADRAVNQPTEHEGEGMTAGCSPNALMGVIVPCFSLRLYAFENSTAHHRKPCSRYALELYPLVSVIVDRAIQASS